MGRIAHLKAELDEQAARLEECWPDREPVPAPEVGQARALVEEARAAVAAAFLSRQKLVRAREAIARVTLAVEEAIRVSAAARARGVRLRDQARTARGLSAGAPEVPTWTPPPSAPEPLATDVPARVVIESSIPDGHPHKESIEWAVRAALAAAGCDWHVWITVPSASMWWGLRVKGPAIDWVSTLQDAAEQTAEAVTARLQPVVRVARAETIYRRGQHIARARVRQPE